MKSIRSLAVIVLLALTAASAAAAQGTRLVILVRHAEAGGEPERDPPLTALGRERAQALATAVADTDIGTIVVSNLQRTRLTAAPVASARGITPVVVTTSGGIEAHVQAVADAVRAAPPGHAVLVAGHSNTIPRIIHALGGPDAGDLCETHYSGLFVMELRDGRPTRLINGSYGPSDTDDPSSCRQ